MEKQKAPEKPDISHLPERVQKSILEWVNNDNREYELEDLSATYPSLHDELRNIGNTYKKYWDELFLWRQLQRRPDESAFPVVNSRQYVSGEGWVGDEGQPGLTVREYFTSLALQGLMANPAYALKKAEDIVGIARLAADMLIEELYKF